MPNLPETYQLLECQEWSSDFSKVTKLVSRNTKDLLEGLQSTDVIVQPTAWSINASDIMQTQGFYNPSVKPPHGTGLEAVGIVVRVGSEVKNFKEGDSVLVMGAGTAYTELWKGSQDSVFNVNNAQPDRVSYGITGLTAWLALHKQLKIQEAKPGSTVLVTAAAGGTGIIVVQLLKAAGLKVIATTSQPAKVKLLQELGVDHIINYKEENLGEVLKRDYPKGVDYVFESVGGESFKEAVQNVATKGQVLTIGSITDYRSGSKTDLSPFDLIQRSVTIKGFFLFNFMSEAPEAIAALSKLEKEGKLKFPTWSKDWKGIKDIKAAGESLHKGENLGKVVVPA